MDQQVNNTQDQFFEEPISEKNEESTEDTVVEVDMIDAAFVAMGGFGKLQKISYAMNTAI